MGGIKTMKLEEKKIYVNKRTREYCQIKEITYFDCGNNPACIVCSGDCTFLNDSKTTVCREVYYLTEFTKKYEEYKEEDNWSIKKANCCQDSFCDKKYCDEAIEKLQQKILEDLKDRDHRFHLTLEEVEEIIKKRFGFSGGKQ